jgi:hypothetical protein
LATDSREGILGNLQHRLRGDVSLEMWPWFVYLVLRCETRYCISINTSLLSLWHSSTSTSTSTRSTGNTGHDEYLYSV